MTARRRLRLGFFGMEGALSAPALRALAVDHEIIGIVRPRTAPGSASSPRGLRRTVGDALRLLTGRAGGAIASLGRSIGAPVWEAGSGADPDVETRLRDAGPDLLCIAGYPWLLRDEVLEIPRLGAVNLHGALLPRHRGPLPLFWIYYHDDRETGVTVHRVTERADAGDILGQDSYPLPRGFPVDRLNGLNAERGAALLRRTVLELADGIASPRPQSEALATIAPKIRRGSPMVDFAGWEVERVWHFLAGLYPRYQEPLTTPDGRPVRYGGVSGYERGATRGPLGTVTRARRGRELHCNGGQVHLKTTSTDRH